MSTSFETLSAKFCLKFWDFNFCPLVHKTDVLHSCKTMNNFFNTTLVLDCKSLFNISVMKGKGCACLLKSCYHTSYGKISILYTFRLLWLKTFQEKKTQMSPTLLLFNKSGSRTRLDLLWSYKKCNYFVCTLSLMRRTWPAWKLHSRQNLRQYLFTYIVHLYCCERWTLYNPYILQQSSLDFATSLQPASKEKLVR